MKVFNRMIFECLLDGLENAATDSSEIIGVGLSEDETNEIVNGVAGMLKEEYRQEWYEAFGKRATNRTKEQ